MEVPWDALRDAIKEAPRMSHGDTYGYSMVVITDTHHGNPMGFFSSSLIRSPHLIICAPWTPHWSVGFHSTLVGFPREFHGGLLGL